MIGQRGDLPFSVGPFVLVITFATTACDNWLAVVRQSLGKMSPWGPTLCPTDALQLESVLPLMDILPCMHTCKARVCDENEKQKSNTVSRATPKQIAYDKLPC